MSIEEELQEALTELADDPEYKGRIIVLPPRKRC
jgi:hypothetical protein